MLVPEYTVMFNYRRRKGKKEAYPVHIRIYIAGQPRKYFRITTPGNVTYAQWRGKDRAWVKKNHPYAIEINDEIEHKLQTLAALNKRYWIVGKSLTMQRIFQELNMDHDPAVFNEFFEAMLKQPPEELSPANLKRYYAALASLNKFNPAVHFYELDEEFFQGLKKDQRQNQLLKAPTICGYFNAYKKILRWSRYNAHLSREREQEMMEKITHPGARRAHKDFLDVAEVLQWQNYKFEDRYIGYKRDRDMFLLEIFTGYYYNDLKTLLKSELKIDPEYGYYLYSQRFKNDNLAIVPLWKFPMAIDIIHAYREEDPDSPYLLRRKAFIEDQAFNRNLKVIASAKMLSWRRPVYNKLGRKTNAQLYIRYGAGLPQLSRMLGHERESSTKSYFQVNLAEIIEGVKQVDFIRLGIGVWLM